MILYPDQLPFENLRIAFDILRTGAIAKRSDELAKTAWLLQGYLFGLTIGEPNQLFDRTPAVANPENDLAINTLSLIEQELIELGYLEPTRREYKGPLRDWFLDVLVRRVYQAILRLIDEQLDKLLEPKNK